MEPNQHLDTSLQTAANTADRAKGVMKKEC